MAYSVVSLIMHIKRITFSMGLECVWKPWSWFSGWIYATQNSETVLPIEDRSQPSSLGCLLHIFYSFFSKPTHLLSQCKNKLENHLRLLCFFCGAKDQALSSKSSTLPLSYTTLASHTLICLIQSFHFEKCTTLALPVDLLHIFAIC